MQSREPVTLSRDCQTIQIPDGNRVTLPAGSDVIITQALGGTYTVMTSYGQMLRVDGRDADAIGKEVTQLPGETAEGSLEDRVWEQLKSCFDPEIPVNIVDLGLVYDCQVLEGLDTGARVTIKMTLTAPGCGMGDVLANDVQQRVENLPGVGEVEVEVVFDPQWSMDMMSEAARLQLGMM